MEAVVKATPILYSKFTCIIYLFIYLWIHSCKMTIKVNNKHKSKWNCKTSRDIADRCLHCKHYCGVSIFIECFMFKSPCLIIDISVAITAPNEQCWLLWLRNCGLLQPIIAYLLCVPICLGATATRIRSIVHLGYTWVVTYSLTITLHAAMCSVCNNRMISLQDATVATAMHW